jgi:hypothetical protein
VREAGAECDAEHADREEPLIDEVHGTSLRMPSQWWLIVVGVGPKVVLLSTLLST